MLREQSIIKRRVWFALGATIVGVGLWAWWARGRPVPVTTAARGAPPFVQLAGSSSAAGSRILQEKAELMDPTPLFFPTEWNYGQRPLSEVRLRQPSQFFGRFEPKLTVPEQAIGGHVTEVVSAPERLSDVLVQGNEAPFAGMGQVDTRSATLPVRAAYLEVSRLGESLAVIEQSLTGIQLPRTDFAPVEFMVVVGEGGLIGNPVLLAGSGWEEVDDYFRTYLTTSYHLGQRLAPGRYRIVVGT